MALLADWIEYCNDEGFNMQRLRSLSYEYRESYLGHETSSIVTGTNVATTTHTGYVLSLTTYVSTRLVLLRVWGIHSKICCVMKLGYVCDQPTQAERLVDVCISRTPQFQLLQVMDAFRFWQFLSLAQFVKRPLEDGSEQPSKVARTDSNYPGTTGGEETAAADYSAYYNNYYGYDYNSYGSYGATGYATAGTSAASTYTADAYDPTETTFLGE